MPPVRLSNDMKGSREIWDGVSATVEVGAKTRGRPTLKCEEQLLCAAMISGGTKHQTSRSRLNLVRLVSRLKQFCNFKTVSKHDLALKMLLRNFWRRRETY